MAVCMSVNSFAYVLQCLSSVTACEPDEHVNASLSVNMSAKCFLPVFFVFCYSASAGLSESLHMSTVFCSLVCSTSVGASVSQYESVCAEFRRAPRPLAHLSMMN